MLPEQVWDAEDLPEARMIRGAPTGSAMPLCWAHGDPWMPRNLCAWVSLVSHAALALAVCLWLEGTGIPAARKQAAVKASNPAARRQQ